MLTPELLAKLTPEAIAGLDAKDKQRVMEILEQLAIPRIERVLRKLRARTPEEIEAQAQAIKERKVPSLADMLDNLRKRIHAMPPEEYRAWKEEHQREHDEWWVWKQEQYRQKRIAEGKDPDGDEIKDTYRKMRETNPRAGGAFADKLLGVETPLEEKLAEPEIEPERVSTNLPRPVSIAEVARAAQEQATRREFDPDFIDRICGEGSDKPSGRSGSKFGFMG